MGSSTGGDRSGKGLTMRSTILVVSADDSGLAPTLQLLAGAGYEARGATTFEDATRLLATTSPDLLIADERLGAFNGLHLVLRGRAEHPTMRAIVATAVKDPCVEAEASRMNALCVVKPHDPAEWLLPIMRTLEAGNIAQLASTP